MDPSVGFSPLAIFHIFIILLIWIIAIGLAVWVLCVLFPKGQKNQSQSKMLKPDQILDLRYARGEISREEYEAMKKDLDLPGSEGR